jgi:hypothetical protein
MVAYLIRRILGGIAIFFVATFFFYSLLVSPSLPPPERHLCYQLRRCYPPPQLLTGPQLYILYALDKPWPINYLAWLFDPNGASGQTFTFPGGEVMSVHMSRETMGFAHSGILVGDFGYSLAVEPDTPALAAYGIDLPLLLSFIFAALFSSMLIITLQRRGRPPFYGFTPPESPAPMIWRRAELWPLG